MKAVGIAREVGAPPDDLAELRDEVIAALALDDIQPERTWSGLEPDPRWAAHAIEADRFVLWGRTGRSTSIACRIAPRSRRSGSTGPRPGSGPAFSPDGRFLHVYSGESDIELWDLERGEIPAAWPADARGETPRRRSAGGRRAGRRRAARLRPAGPDRGLRVRLGFATPDRVDARDLALSGDGRRFAIVRVSGEPSRSTTSHAATWFTSWRSRTRGRSVGWRSTTPGPSWRSITLRAILTYDVTSGEVLARLHGARGRPGHEPFSWFQPGGGLLATTAWFGTTWLWDPIRGRPLAAFSGTCQGWQQDGSRLLIHPARR